MSILKKCELNHNSMLRLIKLSDIGLLGIYYLFFSVITISIIDTVFKKLFKNKNMKKIKSFHLILQLALQVFIIMILAFYLRHCVRNIPFPFEGHYGYKHSNTKEINGGIIISFAVLIATSSFRDKTFELVKRLSEFYDNIFF